MRLAAALAAEGARADRLGFAPARAARGARERNLDQERHPIASWSKSAGLMNGHVGSKAGTWCKPGTGVTLWTVSRGARSASPWNPVCVVKDAGPRLRRAGSRPTGTRMGIPALRFASHGYPDGVALAPGSLVTARSRLATGRSLSGHREIAFWPHPDRVWSQGDRLLATGRSLSGHRGIAFWPQGDRVWSQGDRLLATGGSRLVTGGSRLVTNL